MYPPPSPLTSYMPPQATQRKPCTARGDAEFLVRGATTLVQYFVEFDVKNVTYCRVLDISQIIMLFQETLFAVDHCAIS